MSVEERDHVDTGGRVAPRYPDVSTSPGIGRRPLYLAIFLAGVAIVVSLLHEPGFAFAIAGLAVISAAVARTRRRRRT